MLRQVIRKERAAGVVPQSATVYEVRLTCRMPGAGVTGHAHSPWTMQGGWPPRADYQFLGPGPCPITSRLGDHLGRHCSR